MTIKANSKNSGVKRAKKPTDRKPVAKKTAAKKDNSTARVKSSTVNPVGKKVEPLKKNTVSPAKKSIVKKRTASVVKSIDMNDKDLKSSIDKQILTKNNKAASVTQKRKRSDNRHMIVEMTPDGRIKGKYLDVGHAANSKGLKARDIKKDLIASSTNTGIWLRVPVGEMIDLALIEKTAKAFFKDFMERQKRGRGRNPVDRESLGKKLKNLNLTEIDDNSLRKIEKIIPSK